MLSPGLRRHAFRWYPQQAESLLPEGYEMTVGHGPVWEAFLQPMSEIAVLLRQAELRGKSRT